MSNATNIIGNKKIKVNMQRVESEIKFVRVLFKSDFTIEILFTDFKNFHGEILFEVFDVLGYVV